MEQMIGNFILHVLWNICCTIHTRVYKHKVEVINALIEQGWEAVVDE